MVELGPATDQEMVDAFIRAEMESPRFARRLKTLLLTTNVQSDELFDPEHAGLRRHLLSASRGYEHNQHLFRGFPAEVTWRHATLTKEELASSLFANVPAWIMLSAGTRRIADAVANLKRSNIVSESRQSLNAAILAMADQIREQGLFFPSLIVVIDNAAPDRIVVLEGHTRVTAIVHAAFEGPVPVLIGSSPAMHGWSFY